MTILPIRSNRAAGELDDAEIVERSWGDTDAFAIIFDRHASTVHRFLARRVGAQLADDLTGQTMLVAFDQRRRFDVAQRSALPWLYGIASNLLGRHRRAEARHYRALARIGLDQDTEGHADLVSDRVSAAAQPLGNALARLSATERDIVLLIAWENLSYKEVAQALGIPLGTVRSRLHRTRAKLRQMLPTEENDHG